MAKPSTNIEQLIELHFSNRITPDQKLQLAHLATALTDEQMQLLLEKTWTKYIPDSTLPDAVSDKIIASLFNDEKSVEEQPPPSPKAALNTIPNVAQANINEEKYIWLTANSANIKADPSVVEMIANRVKKKKNIVSIMLA